jgi:phospholipid N-methyltransferase
MRPKKTIHSPVEESMAPESKAPAAVPARTEVTPDAIFQLATGFMSAKHVFIANEVGIFEKLADGPATLDELAQRTALPRRTTRIVADAMVALGLVERHADRYQNAPVATYLTVRNSVDLRPFLRFWNHLSYPRWTRLEEAVRTGRGPFGMLKFTAEEQKIFSQGVEAFSNGQAEALATTYDFSGHRRVLDLGGGTGSFLKAILRNHGHLECTLFEVPAAAAVARERLADSPLAGQIRVVEGDFFNDPIPDGHDAVILANVVHVLPPERNLELFRRIRQRVPAGACLLMVDLWMDPTHTQPLFGALMAGEFLIMTGEGDVYSEEEARGWLQQTGWREVELRPLVGPASLLVATTA